MIFGIMQSVILLNVIRMIVILLIVMAPFRLPIIICHLEAAADE